MEVAPFHLQIACDDDSAVAEARRAAMTLADAVGLDELARGRLALVVTELGTNVRKHAGYGVFLLGRAPEDEGGGVDVFAIDQGPGMADVERCLRDGVSSAGTRGAGLGAVQRLSDVFDVFSAPQRGTVVFARVRRGAPQRQTFERIGLALRFPGEEVCGDAWVFEAEGERARFAVVDGLGHGVLAASAAAAVVRGFPADADEPQQWLEGAHRAARGTRGAAATVVFCDGKRGRATVTGLGNVAVRLVDPSGATSAVTMHGTLGHGTPRFRAQTYDWPGGWVVVHSDGLSPRWNVTPDDPLWRQSAGVVAAVLWRDFHRQRDDATIFVCRRHA